MMTTTITGQSTGYTEKTLSTKEKGLPKYHGNKSTMVVHKAGCNLLEKLSPEKTVKFSSLEKAQQAGYWPCQGCLRGRN